MPMHSADHHPRRRGALLALSALLIAAAPSHGATIAERLAALAGHAPVTVRGEDLAALATLPRIYAATGSHPLWQDPARRIALVEAIRDSFDDGLVPADYHLAVLEDLAAAGDPDTDDDLLATDAYAMLVAHLALGKVDAVKLEPNWSLPLSSDRQRAAFDAIVAGLASGRIRETATAVRPHHYLYEGGRAALARYRQIAADGGWQPLPAGDKLAPGMSDPRVPALRRRLAAEEGSAAAEGGTTYDEPLLAAVRSFQRHHGLPPDGTVGDATRHALNIPLTARIDALRLNLERGRWVLGDIGDGDLVVVDIAGYGVRYVRDRQVIWRGRAIVGRRYRETPVFRAEVDDVVLNPTWTVPPGILGKDVLPALHRGEDALGHKHLAVYDRTGQPIDATSIDWSRFDVAHFPYVLRQAAGEANALGRVKINFRNPYSVYLHDTPSRELFDRDERAFSSGCIRIDHPVEFAALVLGDAAHWSQAALQTAIDTGTTRSIPVRRRVSILLMYWTAEVGVDGQVTFRRDLYGRDARLLRQLDHHPSARDQGRENRPPPA
jgi:murein L,D-transpeptidase YcbB/YkuD